jgi:hypothetical protein
MHPTPESVRTEVREVCPDRGTRACTGVESRSDFSNMSDFQISRILREKKSLSDRHESLKEIDGVLDHSRLAASNV